MSVVRKADIGQRFSRVRVMPAGDNAHLSNCRTPTYGGRRAGAARQFASAARATASVIGWDGRVVGADPDLNIRFQLMRDAFANEN